MHADGERERRRHPDAGVMALNWTMGFRESFFPDQFSREDQGGRGDDNEERRRCAFEACEEVVGESEFLLKGESVCDAGGRSIYNP